MNSVSSSILVVLWGWIGVFVNASSAIELTPSRLITWRLVQLLNVQFLISSKPFGSRTVFRVVQFSKADAPMNVALSGMVISFSSEQFMNAPPLILFRSGCNSTAMIWRGCRMRSSRSPSLLSWLWLILTLPPTVLCLRSLVVFYYPLLIGFLSII